jgi:hypothetical protein
MGKYIQHILVFYDAFDYMNLRGKIKPEMKEEILLGSIVFVLEIIFLQKLL